MLRFVLLLILSLTLQYAAATERPGARQATAERTEESIKIDGNLSEMIWQQATPAVDFVQNSPTPGATPRQRSEVRIAYDNTSLYVGALLYDAKPDSITRELSARDNVGNADFFGIMIDAFQTGQNGVGFFVNPDNVQTELKYFPGGRGGRGVFAGDRNWDAVWESETRLTEQGWVIEMRIPYSALRFPNVTAQTWNVNFVRHLRRARETSFWNEVDPEVQGILNQSGEVTGIRDIKPPVRLNASPFITVGVTNYYDKNASPRSEWSNRFGGGMDVQYGINDAFTLDMTLIPDFSEARSDNVVLNLSAFEQRFSENRQFFQEGTELFNKGGLFYSRRIGGRPLNRGRADDDLSDNEEVTRNPAVTQLLNATKVSGRTANGLGIGVFNAVSGRMQATIENLETGDKRSVTTSPLTNYNVTVFDQNLANNSFVTFINTNVLRDGADYDANVSGTVFELRDRENKWALNGQGVVSQLYFPTDNSIGYSWNLGLDRISGVWRYGAEYKVEDDKYDINDLGFLFNNNSRTLRGNLSWNLFEPKGFLNGAGINLWTSYERLYEPDVFTDFAINLNSRFTTRKFFTFGTRMRFEPVITYDYFDARTPGRFLKFPTNNFGSVWISSDYRKRYAVDARLGMRRFNNSERNNWTWRLQQFFRINNQMNLRLEVEYDYRGNDVGYVGHTVESIGFYGLETLGTSYNTLNENGIGYEELAGDVIIFSQRDQSIFDNNFSFNYNLTNNLSLTLQMRHYYTRLEYRDFLELNPEGDTNTSPYRGRDLKGDSLYDTSFNLFNLDMIGRWRFAPGSDMILVWKNNIFREGNSVEDGYLDNLGRLLDAPQTNSVNFKIVYWLDYAELRG